MYAVSCHENRREWNFAVDYQALVDAAKAKFQPNDVIGADDFYAITQGEECVSALDRSCQKVQFPLVAMAAAGLDKVSGGAAPEAKADDAGDDGESKADAAPPAAPAEMSKNGLALFQILGASCLLGTCVMLWENRACILLNA